MSEIVRGRIQEKFDVSRETLERLDEYVALVQKWTDKISLVSKADRDLLWDRHILDSAGLFAFYHKKNSWVDVGSGGGFPAIVVAILAKDSQPDVKISCIESDRRKSLFLRNAARHLSLELEVIESRVEAVDLARFDCISTRAFASVHKSVSLISNSAKGKFFLLKGVSCPLELTLLSQLCNGAYRLHPHEFHDDGWIIELDFEAIEVATN